MKVDGEGAGEALKEQGRTAQPTYGEVCSGRSGHTAACQLGGKAKAWCQLFKPSSRFNPPKHRFIQLPRFHERLNSNSFAAIGQLGICRSAT